MANVTASLSAPLSITANVPFTVTCVIANAGAAAVTVSHIEASVSPQGLLAQSCPYSMGSPPLGPNMPNSVPASGTLSLSWPCVIFEPQTTNSLQPANQPQAQYAINAVITTTDTTPTTYASPASVTTGSMLKVADQALGQPVAPNSNPGVANFSLPGNSGVSLALGM